MDLNKIDERSKTLWRRYEGIGTLVVGLNKCEGRGRDIVGGDVGCLHFWSVDGYCNCGAWNGYWGEERDVLAYWRNSLAFAGLNSHFEEVFLISKRQIPLEYGGRSLSEFGLKGRKVIYSVADNSFIHGFSAKKGGGFSVIDYTFKSVIYKMALGKRLVVNCF